LPISRYLDVAIVIKSRSDENVNMANDVATARIHTSRDLEVGYSFSAR